MEISDINDKGAKEQTLIMVRDILISIGHDIEVKINELKDTMVIAIAKLDKVDVTTTETREYLFKIMQRMDIDFPKIANKMKIPFKMSVIAEKEGDEIVFKSIES